MRNLKKSAPLRGPLLSALDLEYTRASKAKDLDRMADVRAAVDALTRIWPELVEMAGEGPAELPIPAALQVVAPDYLPPAPGEVSLQDILARADKEPALDDTERRREAKRLVRTAVADVNRITSDDHLRYELALLVVNENVEAMQDMKDVAAASGLPVKEYAKRAIAIHNVRRRRAAQVYGIEQTALNEIDAAVGDRIEAVAAKAVSDIRGEDE